MTFHNTHTKNNRWQFISDRLTETIPFSHWFLLLITVILFILGYYWLKWHTFANFVEAIDHDPQFMKDFVGYYYPMSKQILINPKPVSGYYYTAFFALLLVPIGKLTIPLAMMIWGVIQFICLIILYIISTDNFIKFRSRGAILYLGLYATSFPILHNIKWGQVSTLVTLSIISTFFMANKNKRVLTGILLAFASVIKIYPSLFILYFAFKRDLRTCLAFGLALSIFYMVFPVTILGFSHWIEFEQATNTAISNAKVARNANSQYIAHVGLRWVGITPKQAISENVILFLSIIGYIIFLSCIVISWLLQRKKLYEKYSLSIVAIFISIPFLLKTSWPHYFVYLPFCQLALLSYCKASFHTFNLQGKVISILPVLSVLFSSVFVFSFFPNWTIYNSYGMLFIANLFLLVTLYAIIAINQLQTSQKTNL